jgi:hypothetical protein
MNKWFEIKDIVHLHTRVSSQTTVYMQNEMGWGSVIWCLTWDRVLQPINSSISLFSINNNVI